MLRRFLAPLAFALTIHAFGLTVVFNAYPPTCNYPTGSVQAIAQGGVGPYSYSWSTGGTTETISGLIAGDYTVTVTDFLGAVATETATLVAQDMYPLQDYQHAYCPGQVYHAMFNPQGPTGMGFDPIYAPYTTTVGDPVEVLSIGGPGSGYYYLVPGVADGESFIIDYWDVNGCHGEFWGDAGYLVDWPLMSVLSVEPSCDNESNGSLTFTTSGEGNGMTLMYQVLNDVQVPVNTTPVVTPDAGTFTFEDLPPGDFTLVVRTMNTPSSFQLGYCFAPTQIPITVPSAGPNCGGVSGYTFIDLDADCILDGVEPELGDIVLEIQPGPYYAGSSYGNYNAVLPYGTYTITSNSPSATLSCPNTFTIDGANTNIALNLGHTSTAPLDVSVSGGSGPARPGFQLNQTIRVTNNSVQGTGFVTVTMEFDPTVGFLSATPAQTSVAGTTITWVRPAIPAFEHDDIQVQFQVPPDVGLLGTQLIHTVTATPQVAETNTTNNTLTYYTTIVGSVDPNDKLARTSTGASDALYFINEDEWIDYTIRFQNTGTDTAFNVVVTDTLPPTLDLATLRIDGASHPFTWSLSGRTLRAIFTNILLPDSNVNEPRSHGFVAFRIEPAQPLLPGTMMENVANIFFDFNDPVITEPSVLTAEFSTGVHEQGQGQMLLLPNPVNDLLMVSSDGSIDAITILAADGREVMRNTLRASTASVDVSGLRAGSYFVIATLNNGSVVRERFIKQ